MSDAQVDIFRTVLYENIDVRWTSAPVHSPAWWAASGMPQDPGNSTKLEDLLSDHPHTMFAANMHQDKYVERNSRDYITTATTGAMNVPRLGAIDYFVWVAMTKGSPEIANSLPHGVLVEHGPAEGDLSVEHGMYEAALVG